MKFSRRQAIGGAAAAAALGGAAVAGGAVGRATAPSGLHHDTVAFRGQRQAGIITEVQDRLHFVAFDVVTKDKTELAALLRRWTAAAERMTLGEEVTPNGAVGLGDYTPPSDTGEALGLPPSNLTLTIGFGPGLFGPTPAKPDRKDRFGLASRRPMPARPRTSPCRDRGQLRSIEAEPARASRGHRGRHVGATLADGACGEELAHALGGGHRPRPLVCARRCASGTSPSAK